MAATARDYDIAGGSLGRVALSVTTVALVHVALLSRLQLFGVRPDLPLLVALVVGLLAGTNMGGTAGFLGGIVFDLFLGTPFGLSALVYGVLGFCVGFARDRVLPAARDFPLTLIVAASVAGPAMFTAGLVVFDPDLVPTAREFGLLLLLVPAWNVLLALPTRFAVRLLLGSGG